MFNRVKMAPPAPPPIPPKLISSSAGGCPRSKHKNLFKIGFLKISRDDKIPV